MAAIPVSAGGGKTEWPQSLKDFANRVFSSSTNTNRTAAQEELRSLIYKCYTEGTIESTDWANMKLKSLEKGTMGKSQQGLKKKRTAMSDSTELLLEKEKKEKRARRFENDYAAHALSQQQDLVDISGNGAAPSGNLADRLGSVKPLMNINQHRYYSQTSSPVQSNHQGWMYDFQGSAGPSASQSGNVGLANGIHSVSTPFASFSDHDVANPNVIDWDKDTVVGLSTKLEKPYLRLTSAPDPRNVRTLQTLMQTLDLLKKKWRTEANYGYICDQFKSMRQDLTVQRIKNDFTVKVYEIHARIALEKGDLGEYNQCQSQLRGLYALGLKGCVTEFLAYRVLYLLHTRNRREVNALMAELTTESKQEPAVKHALDVRRALATNNYHAFFQLYNDSPNMNAYIIDHFVDRERISALLVMSRCFRPSLSLSFVATELAFTDSRLAHEFLTKNSAAIYFEPKPQEVVEIAKRKSLGGGKKHKQPFIPFEDRLWDPKAAQAALESARQKFRTVDIKGQV